MFLFLFLLMSCDEKREFDQYIELKPNSKWQKNQFISFTFEVTDTLNNKNLLINLRNNHNYKFNNLFLIAKLTAPNKETVIDTLEYTMAYPDGQFIGQNASNIIENKLFYKKNYRFNQKGKYVFSIGQANRELGADEGIQNLEGITEVGFRIEKIK